MVYIGIDSYYTYINIMSLIRRIADKWGARALSRPKYLESDPSGNSVCSQKVSYWMIKQVARSEHLHSADPLHWED